ncbi:unnamed protein product, partial [Strongylus vulgaris]
EEDEDEEFPDGEAQVEAEENENEEDEDEEFPDGDAQVEAEHVIEDVEGHHDFEQPHLNDNPQPRVVEQPGLDIPPAEDNWRDLDRLGDELTWQRLLGLDGSLVFLERVVWVISLDTLFTIMFAINAGLQKLFSASLSSRASSFAASPTSSVFIHWMIGMMIELPVTRHLRRLVASTSLCFTTIFLIVYLPLVIVQKLYSSLLPYNMSLSADTPLSELSLELLILQVVLPALLEQTQARFLLKTIVMWWCVHVGGALSLDRYLLPDLPNPEHQQDGAGAGAGAQGVGTGLYVCWMSVKMGLLTLHWFHLGLNHLKEAFVNSIYLIYQDGIRNLRARFILTQLIIPVILFLSSLLAFPYLIARYLVGTRLVNYERNGMSQSSSEAAISS